MDFKFDYTYDDNDKIWNTTISGEIDIYNSNQFKEELTNLLEKSKSDIRIDCKELEYIDSTGLGALMSILKKVKQHNGQIYLRNLNDTLKKIFKITNFDTIFILEEGELNE